MKAKKIILLLESKSIAHLRNRKQNAYYNLRCKQKPFLKSKMYQCNWTLWQKHNKHKTDKDRSQ